MSVVHEEELTGGEEHNPMLLHSKSRRSFGSGSVHNMAIMRALRRSSEEQGSLTRASSEREWLSQNRNSQSSAEAVASRARVTFKTPQEEDEKHVVPKEPLTLKQQLQLVVLGYVPGEEGSPAWLNILLVFIPLSFASNYGKWNANATFIFAFLSLVPLAALLGAFTEDLAKRLGDGIGALLNASFGNATELIVSLAALNKKLFTVIKNSMLGSVMGNMLLVLGCSFIGRACAKDRNGRRQLIFPLGKESAISFYSSMLLLAVVGLVIPTAFGQLHGLQGHPLPADEKAQKVLDVSRQVSIPLVLGYIAWLYFQTVPAKQLFDGVEGPEVDVQGADDVARSEVEDDEEPELSKGFAVGGLAVLTVLIAFESEFLVGALEDAAKNMGMSEAFIALILLPIVGNAAEHATAVVLAYKASNMPAAIGVAMGSSIQIAGFLVPVLTIISWIWHGNKPGLNEDGETNALDMDFHPFSTTLMVICVIVVNNVVYDSEGTMLEGLLLLLVYIMVAIAYWHVPSNTDA